jgi:hypothetical protein
VSTVCGPVDRLLQTLKVDVPGATDGVISLHLFNAVDEFLRRTSAWRYEQDIDLNLDMLDYALALPPDAAIVRFMSVMHNSVPVANAQSEAAVVNSLGRLMPEQTFPDGDASFAPVEHDIGLDHRFTYAVYRPDYVTITGVDSNTIQYPLKLVVALSISRGCLEKDCGDWNLDEWMFDMYFQDWLDGAKQRLYGMPAKPWSNKELMIFHGKRFRVAMGSRKQEAIRGFVHNMPVWRFPRGWG